MVHKVIFEIEQYDDTPIVSKNPGMYSMCKAGMDYAFDWPIAMPEQYVLGSMRSETLEWLNTNTCLRGDNCLGFDQQRKGDLRFTRRLWVEFADLSDALLFRLTWGCETSTSL